MSFPYISLFALGLVIQYNNAASNFIQGTTEYSG